MSEPDWTFVASRLLLHHLYKESALQRGEPYGNFRTLITRLVSDGRYDAKVLSEYSEEDFEMFGKALRPERDLLLSYPGVIRTIYRLLIVSSSDRQDASAQDN